MASPFYFELCRRLSFALPDLLSFTLTTVFPFRFFSEEMKSPRPKDETELALASSGNADAIKATENVFLFIITSNLWLVLVSVPTKKQGWA